MGAIVETTCGRLEGTYEAGVHIFRGIPFAAPPVGDRRFRPPQPPEPWRGVRSAAKFGDAAPQPEDFLGSLLGLDSSPTNESCLYLNVWTPRPDGARRPVMVWIHGGAFVMGTGAREINDGTALALRGDVVVVSLNYRLGSFGFLHVSTTDPQTLSTTGNEGILDQVAALEWVQREIGAFGGDPRNVTIFGESAGSISVAVLLSLSRARGLFHRAILQSGSANLVASRKRAQKVTETLRQHLDRAPVSAAQWRGLTADELFAAQLRMMATPSMEFAGLPFLPVIDGEVLPRDPFELIGEGCAADVPVLIGTTSDEMKLFALLDPKAATLDEDAVVHRCERNIPGADAQGSSHGRRAVTLYKEARAARGASITPADLWWAIEADRFMRYPSMRLAELHAAHQVRTYAYLFTWPSPFMGGALGACHALDVPFVFGSCVHPKIAAFTGAGVDSMRLTHQMQDAWIHFARSGDPNHPGLPPWRPYDRERRATMILGQECHGVDGPLEHERRFWETVQP